MLGLTYRKVGAQLGIDQKTARNAVLWARVFEPNWEDPSGEPAFQKIGPRALELRRRGLSWESIARKIGGISRETARRGALWAKGADGRSGGE